MSNIVDILVGDRNLSTLLRSVQVAGFEVELNKAGPFTVFAPTDLAFGKLAEGEITQLLNSENRVKLTAILSYHVVEGRKSFKDLADGQILKTINGKQLLVHVKNGAATINGAKVQARDMQADNGVVHSLDTVVMHVY
jgi:uncharacterized surface protein with fasciclin (FAS1) repeats